ncbi:MAG: hypothetical protein WC360_07725 [Opitutales bacterium]|jgi:hypothetical protein
MTPIPLFLIFLVLTLVYLLLFGRNMKKAVGNKKRALEKLAKELGLTVQGGEKMFPSNNWLGWVRKPFFILDHWRGRELSIYYFSKGSGKNSSPYSALDIPLAEIAGMKNDFKMTISAVGWMSNIGLMLGRKPIATGDETFDKQFAVKSTKPDLAQAILLPELRGKIIGVWEERAVKGIINVHEGHVHYEESGNIRTDTHVRRFAAMAALCHDLADTIDAACSL